MRKEDLFIDIDDTMCYKYVTDANYASNFIIFRQLDGKDIIKLNLNTGDIYVHGNLIENDKQVVEGLRDFLSNQGYY